MRNRKKWFAAILPLAMTAALLLSIPALAETTNIDVVDTNAGNEIEITYTSSLPEYSNGTLKMKASKSSAGLFGSPSTDTNSITIKNISGADAKISFDWEHTFDNTATFTSSLGMTKGGKGSLEISLRSNGTFTITLSATNTKWAAANSTLTLSNFKMTLSKNVTFSLTSNDFSRGHILASYTDTSTSTAYSNKKIEGSTSVTAAAVTVQAKPNTGMQFVAWVDQNNKLVSWANPYEAMSETDATLKAIFAQIEPWFLVDGTLIQGWEDAFAAGTTAMLANNATLTAKTDGSAYTIESGKQLLIPFSNADTGIWGAWSGSDGGIGDGNGATPSTFRTLTVPDGVKIECYGQINVNGQRNIQSQQGANGPGRPSGKHGLLLLNGSGEQLVLKANNTSAGKLYAYGFIAGTGTVCAESGSEVREIMQIYDWAGGTNMMEWYGFGSSDTSKLFAIAHYYIQNIEAPFHIEYGANLYGEAMLYVDGVYCSTAGIIGTGSNAMFLLTEGTYIDRNYDATTDKVTYTLGGSNSVSLGAVSVTVAYSYGLGMRDVTLSSSSYMLPLNCAVRLVVGSGVTVNVDKNTAIMPDAEIIVQTGGTVNVSANVFLFEKNDWLYGSSSSGNDGILSYGSTASRSPKWTYGRGTSQKLTEAQKSAYLEVNGTLNITAGGVFNTDGTATDINIVGSGKIVNSVAGTTSATVYGGLDSNTTSYSSKFAVAKLAGVGENQTIGASTYYGQENNYWYQYVIYGDSSTVTVTDENGTKTSTLNPLDGRDKSNVVGVVAAGGTVAFTTEQPCVSATNAQLTRPDTASGAYTLSEFTGNPTIRADKHYNDGADCDCDFCQYIMLHHSTNVELGNSLNMYFAFWMDSMLEDNWKGYYAVISCDGMEDQIVKYGSDSKGWLWTEVDGNTTTNEPVVYFDGLSAQKMSDTVTVTLFNGSGTKVATWSDSIRDYAGRLLEKYDGLDENGAATTEETKKTTLCTLLVDMLNYGAECQKYFAQQNGTTVAPKDLATADLSETQLGYATESVTIKQTCTPDLTGFFYGSNLITNSSGNFAVGFKGTNWDSVKFDFTNHWGTDCNDLYVYNRTDVSSCTIPKLVIADARAVITITVTYVDYTTQEWTDSIESYCARMIANNDASAAVCTAFMKFSDAAEKYLESGDKL